MNTLFANFQPTEDVIFILSSLRLAELSWIAEEIETGIRNGHLVARVHRGEDQDEHILVPFDADEQLRIALRTIQRYTIEMHKAWLWTKEKLRETLEDPNLQIAITYLGSDESLPLFHHDFESHLAHLDELLRRAWPNGTETYDLEVDI